jgi:glycosyltransferase involved in cell wall biosynthesis
VVLADGWYSWHLERVRPFTTWLEGVPSPLARLAARFGPVRGILLFGASVRSDAVAMIRADPGWRSLLLLRALLGRRPKLVAFHLLDLRPRRGAIVDRLWRPVERWALRRALRAAQVMTERERHLLSARLRIPDERLSVIPFPWRTGPADHLPPAPPDGIVLSAGRASCDWETLFAAAARGFWPLTVVCTRQDLETVAELNREGRASVLHDVPPEEVHALLRGSLLDVICLRESGHSQGQVRLLDAADHGVPVVATDTAGIREYVVDGETAVLVPPGDSEALAAAVERLLADAGERERVRRNAFARSQRWTAADYMDALGALLEDAAGAPA